MRYHLIRYCSSLICYCSSHFRITSFLDFRLQMQYTPRSGICQQNFDYPFETFDFRFSIQKELFYLFVITVIPPTFTQTNVYTFQNKQNRF